MIDCFFYVLVLPVDAQKRLVLKATRSLDFNFTENAGEDLMERPYSVKMGLLTTVFSSLPNLTHASNKILSLSVLAERALTTFTDWLTTVSVLFFQDMLMDFKNCCCCFFPLRTFHLADGNTT